MVLTYSHRITRVLWYSGIASITPWFRLRDYYSVSSNFPVVFDYHFAFNEATLTPTKRISLVWAHSLSLTTTNEIVITFFSSRYLDVSVPWVPLSHTIDSYGDTATLLAVSFLIRKSTDHSLFATTRSLSQLVTSFFGAWCQVILPMPLLALIKSNLICHN